MSALVQVLAEFTDTASTYDKLVELYVEGDYVFMRGGPTGFESFSRSHATEVAMIGWVACAGTPGYWDRCYVPADSIRTALIELGLLS